MNKKSISISLIKSDKKIYMSPEMNSDILKAANIENTLTEINLNQILGSNEFSYEYHGGDKMIDTKLFTEKGGKYIVYYNTNGELMIKMFNQIEGITNIKEIGGNEKSPYILVK